MKRIVLLALASIALGFAGAPANAEVAALDHVVVFDAPSDFQVSAAALGYAEVEPLTFETVNINGFRVLVPANDSAGAMIKILKARFPTATVDSETTDDFTTAN